MKATLRSALLRWGGILCRAARRAGGGCRIRREQIHDLEGPAPPAPPEPGPLGEVQAVVQKNKAERHLRGGEATRRKYLHTASCAAHGGTV